MSVKEHVDVETTFTFLLFCFQLLLLVLLDDRARARLVELRARRLFACIVAMVVAVC